MVTDVLVVFVSYLTAVWIQISATVALTVAVPVPVAVATLTLTVAVPHVAVVVGFVSVVVLPAWLAVAVVGVSLCWLAGV